MTFTELKDRQVRETLCKRFLAGESTLAEERMLKEWFCDHAAEGAPEDEVARLLLILPSPGVIRGNDFPDEDIALFDEIVRKGKRPVKKKWRIGVIAAAAAAISFMLILRHEEKKEDPTALLSSLDILESVQILSGLCSEEIDFLAAEPVGQELVLTLQLHDDREMSYLISKNQKDGSVNMMVMNNH